MQKKIKENELVHLKIDSLSNLGHGVARLENLVIFVRFALPGENIKAKIFRIYKTYAVADLIELISKSKDRIKAKCEYFGMCGGCQYQNLTYEKQLHWKKIQLEELFLHNTKQNLKVKPPIASPKKYNYRSKITPHYHRPKNKKINEIGFLMADRRRKIIDIKKCPIAIPEINKAYNEKRMEVFNTTFEGKKGATLLFRTSKKNINSEFSVLTKNTEICTEFVKNIKFQFPAGTFFQNNPYILDQFLDYIIKIIDSDQNISQFIDTYCGCGLFSIVIAKFCSKIKAIYGIEISESSIFWAKKNNFENKVKFIQNSAEKIFLNLQNPEKSVVIIDPPRKGCDPEFIQQLIYFNPSKIIYISCNPNTQLRDLNFLTNHYKITEIQAFDFFPQTKHLECIAILEKINTHLS